MVSLKENRGFSNIEDVEENNDETSNDILIESDLNNESYNFKTIDTIRCSICMIILSIGVLLSSILLPIYCETEKQCGIKPISFLFYLHSVFWICSLISDQYVQYSHIKVRRRGYLEFYNETRNISQMPLWIISSWSALLLTISTILQDYCSEIFDVECGGKYIRLNKADYVTIFFSIEFLLLFCVHFTYIKTIVKFNRSKSLPDVLRNEMVDSVMNFSPNLGTLDEEIFERQADLIRYYKEHNSMLRRKILELTLNGQDHSIS